jgi:hypothetical protein
MARNLQNHVTSGGKEGKGDTKKVVKSGDEASKDVEPSR